MKNSIQGLVVGFLVGAVDCGLYLTMGVPVSSYDIAIALSFWTIAGWLIHVTQLAIPNLLKGLLVALALNIPWAIHFTAQGMAQEVLPFMVVMGSLFGLLLGWLSGKSLIGDNTAKEARV